MKNKSQFFGTKKETIEWLDSYQIENYTINDDLSVDVSGDVDISYKNLTTIPIKFGNIIGNFSCNNNKLTSLAGSPKSVGANFFCENNKLTSLSSSPKIVMGCFWCNNNELTNLYGEPNSVAHNFRCDGNDLVNVADFLKTNIGGIVKFKLNIKIFKDKKLYNFLNKYFNKPNNRVEIEFKFLKLYLERLELKKNLKISYNIHSKKITKNSYL